MDHEKAKALHEEYLLRMVNEAGVKAAKAVSIRLPRLEDTVTGVLFSNSRESIEDIDFSSRGTPSGLVGSTSLFPEPRTFGHRFVEGDGKTIHEGKPSYPDFLRVYIKREEAFRFAMNIMRRIEILREGDSPLLEIPLFGKLVRVPDDDLEN